MEKIEISLSFSLEFVLISFQVLKHLSLCNLKGARPEIALLFFCLFLYDYLLSLTHTLFRKFLRQNESKINLKR